MSIEVRNISKTFGGYKALDDVNLTIHDGELLALLGPSGSGKTTLLRIIAGLEIPDPHEDSEIRIHQESVAKRTIGERQVGFVFQHYALFRHMTVFENIAFGLRVRPRRQRPSRDAIRGKVQSLLKLIQLENMGHRYPSQLSGGQRQRVALARALAIEPKVLLLDEPFGALDAKVRKGLRDWLRRLHEEIHVTSVLVTHDQEEALEVADRVVVMNQAKIEQVGTPAEVFHQPASEFVMEFLGQVNVFRGRLQGDRAVIANEAFEVGDHAPGESRPAHVYVRPHDLDIQRYRNGAPALEARVARTSTAGSTAKVGLVTPDGQDVFVDLSLDRFTELSLMVGEIVFVTPRKLRVFVQPPEYVI